MSKLLSWLGQNAMGLLGLGSGFATQVMNQHNQNAQNDFNASEAAKNRNFQAQQAQLARDYQTEFYETYQSPSAMVRQFKDAGMNPALMAGGYNPPSAVSTSSPSGSAASAASPNYQSISSMIDAIASLAKLKQEINESKSREAANYASAEKSFSGIRVDNASIKQMSIQNEQMLNSIKTDNKRVLNETRHINAILTQISASNKVSLKQVDQIDAAIKRMSVQNALDVQQKITLCSQQVLLEFQAEESGMRQHEILSKIRLNNSQANAMSETMYEQRFKNKYLYLYGSYPPAEAAKESAVKWTNKLQKNFEPY